MRLLLRTPVRSASSVCTVNIVSQLSGVDAIDGQTRVLTSPCETLVSKACYGLMDKCNGFGCVGFVKWEYPDCIVLAGWEP